MLNPDALRKNHESLCALIQPVSVEAFMDHYWLKTFLYADREAPDVYSQLFSWKILNDVLEAHQPSPPNLLLRHKGLQIPAARYLCRDRNRPKGRIDAASLESLLTSGATLILNSADTFYMPLRRMLDDLEKTFFFPIHANLYAAWANDEAFPLHWDEQEAFIVQIAGRKQWTIYRPTAVAPDRSMKPEPAAPTSEPDLQINLEPGQSLYMPKGWWHYVKPLSEPTLHLTITCEMPNGIDLLRWLMNRLVNSEVARQPVPYQTSSNYLNLLGQMLADEISRPDTIQAFWDHSLSKTISPLSIFPQRRRERHDA